jgi:hypothetical protein
MIRKHSKKVLGGMGTDGREGENFSRDHACDPWNPPAIGGGKINSRGHGKYTNDESGLRNKPADDQSGGVGNKDIADLVEKNQLDGRTGPVKYGID